MTLTPEQIDAIQPLLQKMSDAMHTVWEMQRGIEAVVETELDSMTEALGNIAAATPNGYRVTKQDVFDYMEDCRVPTRKP